MPAFGLSFAELAELFNIDDAHNAIGPEGCRIWPSVRRPLEEEDIHYVHTASKGL